MAEQLIRPSVAAFLEFQPIIANYTTAQANGDYYTMGLSFSELWKYTFDGSLNN
jgi:hypothetical protein